jgi:hypothetical protein
MTFLQHHKVNVHGMSAYDLLLPNVSQVDQSTKEMEANKNSQNTTAENPPDTPFNDTETRIINANKFPGTRKLPLAFTVLLQRIPNNLSSNVSILYLRMLKNLICSWSTVVPMVVCLEIGLCSL